MKKIIIGLAAAGLILGASGAPVYAQTAAVSPANLVLLQQLLARLIDLQKQLIRLLARQNPPATLLATSTIPMTSFVLP